MNLRPPGPQPGALPDCATPRDSHSVLPKSVWTAGEHTFVSDLDGTPTLRCSRCGEWKPREDFAWRRRRKLQPDTYCRPCRSEYGKEHYAKHKQRYIEQAAAIKRRKRIERTTHLIEYFRTHPCVDCSETDPVVLEFDHLGDEEFDIGTSIDRRPWAAILAEIEKCDVVCANCHRRRNAIRRGSMRAVLTGLC